MIYIIHKILVLLKENILKNKLNFFLTHNGGNFEALKRQKNRGQYN